MPQRVTSRKKKKKGFFSRYASGSRGFGERFLQGAEDAVTGFPSGVVMLAHALDQALPASPIPGVDEGHQQSYKPIAKIGKQSILQMKEDLRHPLRDPFSTLLTVGGVVAPAVGATTRGAAAASAASKAAKGSKLKAGAKAAARPKPKTRKLKTIKKPDEVTTKDVKRAYSGGTYKSTTVKKNSSKELEIEANPNPLVRGIRKVTLDPLYERSRKAAEADFKNPKAGRYARMVERRTMDQRNRYAENIRDVTDPKTPVQATSNPVKNVATAPMDLMRLSMYTRPRYYVQNLGGTAQLLAHAGVSIGDVKTVAKIAKSDPELYSLLRAAGGETGTKAISNVATGSGRLGQVSKWAAGKANLPESHMRTVAIWKAAKDYGVTTPAELKAILKKPDSNEAQLIMARGNESVVDYGRIGGSGTIGKNEKKFVQSGLPIFYPMVKGFSRYGARFPTQHPIQSAAINQIGQQGKEFQRENLGGEPQPWFPYITPIDKDKTLNLQNTYAFSPGGDTIRQALQAAPGSERHPTLNLLQALGPLPELLTGAATGRQLATGFEYDADTLDKYGPFLTALGDTAKSVVPGMEYLGAVPGLDSLNRTSAAYGDTSLAEKLALATFGPGLVQRPTNYKKVRQPKKRKPGRRKKSGSRF